MTAEAKASKMTSKELKSGSLSSELSEVASFDELKHVSGERIKFKDELLRGIYGVGFERPSHIQQRGIPFLLEGKDTIIQAQSGAGKTGTFCIAALQKVDEKKRGTQVIVLSPTRELADQTFKVMSDLSLYQKITCHKFIGGTKTGDDIQALRNGVQVAVGTPGRIMDLMNRRCLLVSNVNLLILDEADEMLSRGFKDQVKDIFQMLPEGFQVCLCSATMSPEVLELTSYFMVDPRQILVPQEELSLKGIKQFYVDVIEEQNKFMTLCDLYATLTITQCIIYCNTCRKVDELSELMIQNDHAVSSMHGSMSPEERNLVMSNFRSGVSRVLITTDLLARGIDVQQVSLVINYDLPPKDENYLHRIGRSGRFGRKGTAINFVTADDTARVREIEDYFKVVIAELPANITELI